MLPSIMSGNLSRVLTQDMINDWLASIPELSQYQNIITPQMISDLLTMDFVSMLSNMTFSQVR